MIRPHASSGGQLTEISDGAGRILESHDAAAGVLTASYQRWVGDRFRPVEVRGDGACSGYDHVDRHDLAGNGSSIRPRAAT